MKNDIGVLVMVSGEAGELTLDKVVKVSTDPFHLSTDEVIILMSDKDKDLDLKEFKLARGCQFPEWTWEGQHGDGRFVMIQAGTLE